LKRAKSIFNYWAGSFYVAFYAKRPLGIKSYTLQTQKILSTNLKQWRRSLPNVMKWSDGDPPSIDINTAWLRVRYYDTYRIIYQPLLLYRLQIAQEESAYRDLGLGIRQAYKIYVRSTILSAEAFDRFNG
jgi:hypothetical protein